MVHRSQQKLRQRGGHKQQVLVNELRRRIMLNHFRAGTALPPCRKLAREFDASPMTVQRALRQLVEGGFATAQGRRGNRVHEHPPHLFRYGMVFASDPSGGELGYWPPAWKALNDEALRVEHVDPRRRVVPYYDLSGHSDVKDFQRLVQDVTECRLAGVMLVGDVYSPLLLASAVFQDPHLARVGMFCGAFSDQMMSIPANYWAILDRGLHYLASRGRKRIAVLDVPNAPLLDEKRISAEVKTRGMLTRPYWLLGIDHRTPSAAKRIVQLLMSGKGNDRPDGLVVANPFLVEHATAGVVAAGLHVPEELDVVAGGNYPHLTRSLVPVKWLVTDIREAVRVAIEAIDGQRRGEAVAELKPMPDLFEEELPAIDPLSLLAQPSGQ